MDPEQRLLVVVEYLVVELDVLVLCALGRFLAPKRMDLIHELRPLLDLQLCLLGVLLAVGILGGLLRDLLQHHIAVLLLICHDGLTVLRQLGKINLHRHERTVLIDDGANFPLIVVLQAVIIQVQRDLCSMAFLAAFAHLIFRTAVAYPVHRLGILLIGKGINLHQICHHERGIEAQTEVSDDLVIVGLVLILLDEIRRTGEGDLVDVLFNLFLGHTDTVVAEGNGLLLRIHGHIHSALVILRLLPLADERQLLQLCHRIAGIGDLLTNEDILIGIHPLLDDRENVLTVDG